MKQCTSTQSWPTVKGVIAPLMCLANRPNHYGIKHTKGKKAGQLKKYKLLTQEEIDYAEAQISNGQRED
jgi:hypothetical protein